MQVVNQGLVIVAIIECVIDQLMHALDTDKPRYHEEQVKQTVQVGGRAPLQEEPDGDG